MGAINNFVDRVARASVALSEVLSNKATNFTVLNDTLYPSVLAVKTYTDTLVVGSASQNFATNTLTASGGIKSISAAALIGYGTGAGGTVTQTTSKSTGVTLNKPCGRITMHNASLAAGAEVGFTMTNSLVLITSVVNIHPTSSFSGYSLRWFVDTGAVGIYVKNETGAPLSEAVILNFSVNAASNA